MTKIGIIDERDCFGLIEEYEKANQAVLLEPEYFLAPNPSFLERMIEFAKGCGLIILHKVIWLDECRSEDTCQRLDTFETAIAPVPLLKVGKVNSNHHSCPAELLKVFQQVKQGYETLGGLLGAKVLPPNKGLRTDHLIIRKIEIFGKDGSDVGVVLENPITKDTVKYFKLTDLRPYTA